MGCGNIAEKHAHRASGKNTPVVSSKHQPLHNNRRSLHSVEGVLEVQKMLLQKLAAYENEQKGLSGSMSQPSIPLSKVSLSHLMNDTCLAVQLTWINRKNK